MANIVAADFNPPKNSEQHLLSSVGTVHLMPFICSVPTELIRNTCKLGTVD